ARSPRLPREPERALGDQVALDLVRPRVDRVGAREEEEALERGELVGRRLGDLRLRAEHVHRELAEAAVPGRPEDLRDHRLARELRAPAGEHAQRVPALELEPDPGVGDALADQRVARTPVALRRQDDLAELVLEGELLAQRRGTALEGE